MDPHFFSKSFLRLLHSFSNITNQIILYFLYKNISMLAYIDITVSICCEKVVYNNFLLDPETMRMQPGFRFQSLLGKFENKSSYLFYD